MDHKIVGTTMPVLEIQLAAGESVVAESGEFSWMTDTITLETAATGKAGGKGVFGALKRAVSGGSLFLTEYTASGGPGMIAFAVKMPGAIQPIEVAPGKEYMVHRRGYLCGTPGVNLEIGFQQRLGSGVLGGMGFIMQHVSGEGSAWIELDGELVGYGLGAGQTLRVHPGHVGMYEASVGLEIETIPGVKNMIFGGDGIYVAKLVGPGNVWLQTLPLPNLAHALSPYLPHVSNDSSSGGFKLNIGS
jgi:uncharacterized protein (AIM24 family)